ncbi:DUF732 domain-containing protein [Mycobacterium alsense]|uniref:DUF732 domain-containing protein n=1 Tax=Mycobacterium alsense TaxID=324058 RepID=A0AA41XNS1_9MYCO|nr:DUF732 domain-containing protein [Mycobacterium alsense]MCV7379038.1 DUF732 domain-containing protein [Mycobacterium alsense]
MASVRAALLAALLAGPAAAVAPLAATAPAAHADAADDAFLAALHAKGIYFGSPQQAIISGHEVCDELDIGKTPNQVAQSVMSNTDLDGFHAGYFVGASIRAYCPRHAS